MSVHESVSAHPNGMLSSLSQAILYTLSACLLYFTLLAVYRLYLCPQARFPGPRLAGLTYWYEYYYDVHLPGKFIFHIQDLHKNYGPVVRINPYELHINDPDFYGEIYHNAKWITHRDRWFNLDYLGDGLAFTMPHDLHRSRRDALSPYFSMQSIRALQPRLINVVNDMVTRLQRASERGEILNLQWFGAAFAMDVVTEYAFGKDGASNLMLKDEMGKAWTDLTRRSIKMNPFARQWKTLTKAMVKMPGALMARLNEDMAMRIGFQDDLTSQVKRIMAEGEEKRDVRRDGEPRTMFHELLFSSLSPQDKSLGRLADEASMVVGAGGETTAQVIAKTFYHILANPDVLSTLRKELRAAVPDLNTMPSIATLQNLPYLCAVVEEGVRIALPVPARSPRVFQDHALQFGEWTIEPGIAVSCSPYVVGTSERVFPEPFKFKPERWLGSAGKELQKYAVTFGKGRRGCLGKNLAYAELWYCLGVALRRFEIELFETSIEDVTVVHDYFIGFAKDESMGVRAKVVRELS